MGLNGYGADKEAEVNGEWRWSEDDVLELINKAVTDDKNQGINGRMKRFKE